MEREKIIEDIQEIQDKVDNIGFKGNNEHDLFLREEVADYVEKLLGIGVDGISTLYDNKEFHQQLLNRWGFTEEGGISAEDQLKIFSLLDWLEENKY